MQNLSASFMPRRSRLPCAAAALFTTGTLATTLLSVWHQQAGPSSLAATPEVLAEVALCEAERTRAARESCKWNLVVARSPSETRSFPVAAR